MFKCYYNSAHVNDPGFNGFWKIYSKDLTEGKKGALGATIDAYRFPVQFLSFRPPTLFMADQAVRATYGKEAAWVWVSDLGLWET